MFFKTVVLAACVFSAYAEHFGGGRLVNSYDFKIPANEPPIAIRQPEVHLQWQPEVTVAEVRPHHVYGIPTEYVKPASVEYVKPSNVYGAPVEYVKPTRVYSAPVEYATPARVYGTPVEYVKPSTVYGAPIEYVKPTRVYSVPEIQVAAPVVSKYNYNYNYPTVGAPVYKSGYYSHHGGSSVVTKFGNYFK